MLEYCCSAFESSSLYEHFIASYADDWFSNCCIKSVDHCLSGIFVVERYLFLSQIEVLEFYWSESKWSWMSLSQCLSKLSWVFQVELLVFLFLLNYRHRCLINLFRRCFILFTFLSFRALCFLCSSKQILFTFLGSCSNLCFCISNSTFERLDFVIC